MTQPLSEYELQRLENIKKNQALLKSLDLQPLSKQLPTPRPTPQKKPTKTRTKKVSPRKNFEANEPRRVSLRLRNIPVNSQAAEEEIAKQEVKRKEIEENEQLKRRRYEGVISIDNSDSTTHEENQKFLGLLNKLTMSKRSVIVNDENVKPEDLHIGEIIKSSVPKLLKEEAQSLKIRHAWSSVQVTPSRVYCAAFHPSPEKYLVIAGDKDGSIGFWDILAKGEGSGDDEDEGGQPVVWKYKPHSRSITSMQFSPVDLNKIFTSSYDESVRYFDATKAAYVEAFVPVTSENFAFTNINLDNTGNILYFSTLAGHVGVHDLRSPLDKFQAYQLHEDKVGCIHLNPVNNNLLLTASNDRTIALWDIRMMATVPAMNHKPTKLGESSTNGAVTSAYWSPDGSRIVSTAYDDKIRLYSSDFCQTGTGSAERNIIKIQHCNRTGAWVTLLKSTWSQNMVARNSSAKEHPYFVVGSMDHPVDIFSGITGESIAHLYDAEKVRAVPAVNCFHPGTEKMVVASGNAQGKMVCWS